MRYQAKVVGRVSIPKDRRVVLDHVKQMRIDYSGLELVQFCTIGCKLDGCRFENSRIDNAQFGSGRDSSEFIECSFDGAHMEMGPGGYARFVRCSFRNVEIHNWICFAVELVDCVFSGKLQRAIFNGAVPMDKRTFADRDQNEFRGNDFSGMELIDVTFRTGVDLTLQRLPSGPDYLYLSDAARAIERARSELADPHEDHQLKRTTTAILDVLEKSVKDGQRQMLLKADNFYSQPSLSRKPVEKVFWTLRRAAEI
jgi:hypothetical protein